LKIVVIFVWNYEIGIEKVAVLCVTIVQHGLLTFAVLADSSTHPHAHTHTQPFYGPLRFCPGLSG